MKQTANLSEIAKGRLFAVRQPTQHNAILLDGVFVNLALSHSRLVHALQQPVAGVLLTRLAPLALRRLLRTALLLLSLAHSTWLAPGSLAQLAVAQLLHCCPAASLAAC